MKRRLRLCSQGELFHVVVQICNNVLGVDDKEFWRVFASYHAGKKVLKPRPKDWERDRVGA